MDVLRKIKEEKVIAIVRGVSSENIIAVAKALKDGGISCVEAAFDQKNADVYNDTLKSIRLMSEHFGSDMAIGAGTVMSVKNVEDAFGAGARYIISPNVNFDVIRRTKQLGLVSIPGAATPSEAVWAKEAGADIIKLFPAGEFGASYVKTVVTPLNHIPFFAVGNITEKNAPEFIRAGAAGVCVGRCVVNTELIAQGRFDEITAIARKFRF